MAIKLICALILILARVQQFVGNLTKIIFILHFKLFPNKRFVIPKEAPPLLFFKHKGAITPILWQTNYTNNVTLSVYVNYLWNRMMAAGHSYRFFDDTDCVEYISHHFPGAELQAYNKLNVGAAKADFWRVLALLKEGGVYLDLDAALCWPPSFFTRKSEREILLKMPDGRITNYCFASAAGNPLLKEISFQIQKNIKENIIDNVFDMTGPGVFHQIGDRKEYNIVSSRLVSRQGQFTNKTLQYPQNRERFWVIEQREKNIVNHD